MARATLRMRFWTLTIVTLLCLSLAGCSVVMASRQPSKKDLDVLQHGTARDLVIGELGVPTSGGQEGGRNYDFFAFEQGYSTGTKVSRAVFHAAADTVTLGLWEVVGTPTEAIFSGTDVVVKVLYRNRQVDEVVVLRGGKVVKEVPGARYASERDRKSVPPDSGYAAAINSLEFAPGYEQKVAAVIGINDYERWPPLEGATLDAERVSAKLREKGFDVIELYDAEATRERILQVLGEDLQGRTDIESLAVIFFAGHGQTETLPNGGKRGYIVPVDSDPERVFSTAISMEQLRDLSNRLPAKHVYYAMDSCYSGLGLTRGIGFSGGGPDESYLANVTARRAVQMITAGREGEVAIEVQGRGIFTDSLLAALDGAADFNEDGFVTASEIGAFVPGRVSAATQSKQTPMYGTLEGSGEVIFLSGDGPAE